MVQVGGGGYSYLLRKMEKIQFRLRMTFAIKNPAIIPAKFRMRSSVSKLRPITG